MHVNFTRLNKMEAMYDWRGSTFTFTRHLPTLRLFYFRAYNLRAYARKNYATVQIHLKVLACMSC